MKDTWAPNEEEYRVMRKVVESDDDHPVLMININNYLSSSGFPDGKPYSDWMQILPKLAREVGAKILWRVPVLGQPIGHQNAHEIISAWYPPHKAFLSLKDAPSAAESFRLRELCVADAVVHRCPEDIIPNPQWHRYSRPPVRWEF